MKKMLVSQVLVILFVVFLVLGISCPATAQSGKARELTFSTYTPSTHHISIIMTDFCKEVEKATGGQIKVTMYHSGTLTKPDQVLDGLIKGICDFGLTVAGYNRGRLPLMEVADLPIVAPSCEKMSQVCLALYKKFQPKEFSEIKVLGFLNSSGSFISTNKPVSKFADLAGQSIRCSGADVPAIKALGATPVAMPITQAYEALQRGVCDGTAIDYTAIKAYKLGEVVKIHIEYSFRNTLFWFGMNLKTYNSLTPEQQKIITDLGEKYTTLLGRSRDEEGKKGRQYLVDLGNTFVKLPPEEEKKWADAMLPLLNQYVQEKTALGLPAKEALDFVLEALK